MDEIDIDQTYNLQEVIAGRYRIERFLGAGGMGSVYIVRDQLLGEMQIALKVLHPSLASNKTFSQRFLQEVELMRRVSHKNVIRTFDVGVADGLPYYTMEFIEGRNLAEIEQEYFLDPDNLTDLIVQICHGLYAIHSLKIVHRDLKPENVMLAPDGCAKIADFGIAKQSSSKLTDAGTVIGSPNYMAPEVWQGLETTSRTDLYSLGVILYECISGSSPFESASPAGTMVKHLNQVPAPLIQVDSRVPLWVSKVVSKLLEKNPQDRYPDALSVITQLSNPEPEIVIPVLEEPPLPAITQNSTPAVENKVENESEKQPEKAKTPTGLLLSSNPTSSEIAEQEEYFSQIAQKRKDKIATTLEKVDEEAKAEATRKLKIWLLGSLYLVITICCTVFLFKFLQPSPEQLREREVAALKAQQAALSATNKEHKSSAFEWLSSTSNAPAQTQGVAIPKSITPQAVVSNSNSGGLSNDNILQKLTPTAPLTSINLSKRTVSTPQLQSQPVMQQIQQAPQTAQPTPSIQPVQQTQPTQTVPTRSVSTPALGSNFYNKIAPQSQSVKPTVQQSAPVNSNTSTTNAPVIAPEVHAQPVISWISSPNTVRDFQESLPGVEEIISKVNVVGANALMDFNNSMNAERLDLIQRRAFLIRELRGIEVVQANRDSKAGKSTIDTNETRIESLQYAFKTMSQKVNQAKAQLAKISALANELNTTEPLSDSARVTVNSLNPKFGEESKDLDEATSMGRVREIVADKQPQLAAALVNYSQAQQIVRHNLDLVVAAQNQDSWQPSIPELRDLRSEQLEEHKIKIKAQLDQIDSQAEPITKVISESSLAEDF